ncbi:hypothetical protein BsWGS_12119 [Bradybaena similaris]
MQPLVFLFVAVITVGVCQEYGCAPGWIYFDYYQHCYGYGSTAASWAEAQAICQSQGTTMADVPELGANNFLMVIARNKGDECVWLDASDIFKEGVWRWSSRYIAFDFTNWYSGEPSNGTDDEDCLNMNREYNYTWSDANCHTKCNFICSHWHYYDPYQAHRHNAEHITEGPTL